MPVKKTFFFAIFCLVFLFSANFSLAQTCSDPMDPTSETGQCRSSCFSDEHQISGTCMGQVCCAGNPTSSTGLPLDEGSSSSSSSDSSSGYSGSTSSTGSSGFPLSSGAATSSGGEWSLRHINTFGLPGASIYGIVSNILIWILGIFGILGLLGFLISGVIYLTAAGDEDRMGYAKRAMQYSIIGVIVGLIGVVIIQAVNYALNSYSSF